MDMENYFFEYEEKTSDDKVLVLIIYDIVNDGKRNKLAKYLQGYGFRIQKSAFEAVISKKKYSKLVSEVKAFISDDDSLRIYKIIGRGQITSYGKKVSYDTDEIVII